MAKHWIWLLPASLTLSRMHHQHRANTDKLVHWSCFHEHTGYYGGRRRKEASREASTLISSSPFTIRSTKELHDRITQWQSCYNCAIHSFSSIQITAASILYQTVMDYTLCSDALEFQLMWFISSSLALSQMVLVPSKLLPSQLMEMLVWLGKTTLWEKQPTLQAHMTHKNPTIHLT